MTLQVLVVPDKYDRNYSGMDKSRLLDLYLRIWWEVEMGVNYVGCQWESIKSNLLAISEFYHSVESSEMGYHRGEVESREPKGENEGLS